MANLKTGFPSAEDYKKLNKDEHFIKLEEFSKNFLQVHHEALKEYKKKWVKDPLHQWSRQWEYPFALERLLPVLRSGDSNVQILDAGSGVTFFPYYLKSINPESATIHCCDYDKTLHTTFDLINYLETDKVLFQNADLHKLPFEDSSFDAIYCISVLEHTKNYKQIIQEFKRVLKTKGTLVLTFDISIDGTEDISVDRADELIQELAKHFQTQDEFESIEKQLVETNPFTTLDAKKIDPKLLPWKSSLFSKLKSLIGKAPRTPLLTFYCLNFFKKS